MKNIMLDIETLDNKANAAIVSIGAVYFDENGTGEEFYCNIDFNSVMLSGGTVGAETLEWWLQQNEYARSSLLTNQKRIQDALEAFTSFCDPEAKIWGNGASFDNVILASTYKRLHRIVPWKFFNDRCYRTIKNLFNDVEFERIGIHHNALDDAKSQAEHLIKIAKKHGIAL